MILPCGTLAGFVVELQLKAYLLHKGVVAESELKNKYGHDLSKLLQDANEHGLGVTGLDVVVSTIANHHSDHSYRYLPEGHSYRPLTAVDVQVLDALDDFVGPAIEALGEAIRRRTFGSAIRDPS